MVTEGAVRLERFCSAVSLSLYLAAAFSDSRSYPLNRRSGARLRCDSKSCLGAVDPR